MVVVVVLTNHYHFFFQVDAVLGPERMPGVEDLRALQYTTRVINEGVLEYNLYLLALSITSICH